MSIYPPSAWRCWELSSGRDWLDEWLHVNDWWASGRTVLPKLSSVKIPLKAGTKPAWSWGPEGVRLGGEQSGRGIWASPALQGAPGPIHGVTWNNSRAQCKICLEQGGAHVIKGLETAGTGESSWLQNMKKKVFITCFNKKKSTSMRAQHTAEAILREVYSKGRMCVRDLSLIALLKSGGFLCYFFCFGLSSWVERPALQKAICGRSEMIGFSSLFLA